MLINVSEKIFNKSFLSETVYRPGSLKWMLYIREKKEQAKTGKWLPESHEKWILNTELGERGIYNGRHVWLDWPEPINEHTEPLGENDYSEWINESEIERALTGEILTKKRLINENFNSSGDFLFVYRIYEGEIYPVDIMNKYDAELFEAEYKGKKVELGKPSRGGSKKKYKVYVKSPDTGNVIKVEFGDVKGGLKSKIHDPEARKSFAARHDCENKNDKTKPGYWSCRLPRYWKELGLKKNSFRWW
jgi:hypothetical protein